VRAHENLAGNYLQSQRIRRGENGPIATKN